MADCGIQWNFLGCHILCYHLMSSSVYCQSGDEGGTEITGGNILCDLWLPARGK